jgi:translation initiation factor IF-3
LRRKKRLPVEPPNNKNKERINEKIRINKILLIDKHGEKVGVVETRKALQQAKDAGLDLVEVAPNSRPPVCKIMNYGKFLYEKKKQEREAKKNRTVQETKEIRLRPSTDVGDLQTKAKQAMKFISEGNKVQIELRFRGRENARASVGEDTINKFIAMLENIKIAIPAKKEGRRMLAVVVPA